MENRIEFKFEKDRSLKEIEELFNNYLKTNKDEDRWKVVLAKANKLVEYSTHLIDVYSKSDFAPLVEQEDVFIDLCTYVFKRLDTYNPDIYKFAGAYIQLIANSYVNRKVGTLVNEEKYIESKFGSKEKYKYCMTQIYSCESNQKDQADTNFESLFFMAEHEKYLEKLRKGLSERDYKLLLQSYGEDKKDSKFSRAFYHELLKRARRIIDGDIMCYSIEARNKIKAQMKADYQKGATILKLKNDYDCPNANKVLKFLGIKTDKHLMQEVISLIEAGEKPQIVATKYGIERGIVNSFIIKDSEQKRRAEEKAKAEQRAKIRQAKKELALENCEQPV